MIISCTLKKPLVSLFNTQQRFAEHTGISWGHRSLDYVICHSFLGENRGAFSIFCESQQIFNTVLWRLARSHQSLDNSFNRWHILLFVPFFWCKNVSSEGFDPRPLALSSSVWSKVPCLRFHQYQPWLFICMYQIMHTASCAFRLSHIKVVNNNNCIKNVTRFFLINILKEICM